MDKDKKKYIYESPDKGKTIYQREFGDYNSPRELVEQPTLSRDIEFKTITDILARANLFGLEVEVMWSSLKALKEAKSEISILTALQRGAEEWDI